MVEDKYAKPYAIPHHGSRMRYGCCSSVWLIFVLTACVDGSDSHLLYLLVLQ